MLALAIVAGGADVDKSQTELHQLSPAAAEQLTSQARSELAQMSLVKLSQVSKKTGTADFSLIFDGSDRPDHVVYRSGDSGLRGAEGALSNAKYPVLFPDDSSVKIIRNGSVVCSASGCSVTLQRVSFSPPLSQW